MRPILRGIIAVLFSLAIMPWSCVLTNINLGKAFAQEVQDKPKQKEKPDVQLYCETYSQITVTAGPVDEQGKQPQLLSQDGLKTFLKDKTPKNRMIIYLAKGIDWQERSGAKRLAAFEAYAESLGYKELTIIGSRSFWIPVIYDSTKGGPQKHIEYPNWKVGKPAPKPIDKSK